MVQEARALVASWGWSLHDCVMSWWCFWHPVRRWNSGLCGHVSRRWGWRLSLNGINTVPQSLREAALTWFPFLDAWAVLTTTCLVALAASHAWVQFPFGGQCTCNMQFPAIDAKLDENILFGLRNLLNSADSIFVGTLLQHVLQVYLS